MKTFLDRRETESREELVQLIGLPQSYAYGRYKESIPVHAHVTSTPLYTKFSADKLENRFAVAPTRSGTTAAESNCWDNKLDPPESFAVKTIGVVFSPDSEPEDRQRFCEFYTLEFWIGKKLYFRSPVAFLFSVEESNLFDKTNTLKGAADLKDFPQVIPYGISFYTGFSGTAFGLHSKLSFWVVYQGLYLQGVC